MTYPVVYDDDMDIWSAFNNQYWPAKYVTDRQGNIRYEHFGEGEYSQTEQIIRVLLGVDKKSPKAADPKKPESKLTAAITPETYLGSERGVDRVTPGLEARHAVVHAAQEPRRTTVSASRGIGSSPTSPSNRPTPTRTSTFAIKRAK